MTARLRSRLGNDLGVKLEDFLSRRALGAEQQHRLGAGGGNRVSQFRPPGTEAVLLLRAQGPAGKEVFKLHAQARE